MGGKARVGGVNWKTERLRQELRVKRANAEMRELQRDRAIRCYHRADFVADLNGELLTLYKLALSALPAKLAPLVAGESDAAVVAEKITRTVREMQDGLARFQYLEPGYLKGRFQELEGRDVFEAAPECFEGGGKAARMTGRAQMARAPTPTGPEA